MSLEINTEDFWKELDQRVLDARTERKLFIEEITKLREQVAAQAAVIEKLREALSVVMWFVPNHPTATENKRRFAILNAALAIPTDSTQILDEVRRAERERVAQFVQQGTGDWMLGKKIATAIRAME